MTAPADPKDKRDARYQTRTFEAGSVSEYFRLYRSALVEALDSVDPETLERATALVRKAKASGRRVFVAGNGGSAAISDHLCCDWTKGTFSATSSRKPLLTHSLAANASLLTALGNDQGYEHVFASQVEMLCEPGDLLLLISSSGNSANIVEAARAAKKRGVGVIALTGFLGGEVKRHADITLHVKFENYGVVEDTHQALMHVIAQFIFQAEARGVD